MEDEEKHEYACMICGSTLVYSPTAVENICTYCGEVDKAPISCPNGHYVCDSCHSSDAISFLQNLSEREDLSNPVEIIEIAYSHPSFKFHGPEHHSLVPATILLSLRNQGIKKPDGSIVSVNDIYEGIRRGSKIPGGYCGYAGTCGGCVGAGIAVAILLGSTPKTAKERDIAHKATQRGIEFVRDGLIRCCKRSTFYGITAAIETLNEIGVNIGPVPEHKSCKQWQRNRDCAKEQCVFFPDV